MVNRVTGKGLLLPRRRFRNNEGEYAVLAAPDGPCFPEGTYELRDEFRFGEHGGVSIGWGFRIRVER